MRLFTRFALFVYVSFRYWLVSDMWIFHQASSTCLLAVLINSLILGYFCTWCCEIFHWGCPICSFIVSIMFTFSMWSILIAHQMLWTCSLNTLIRYTNGRIFDYNLSWVCSLRLLIYSIIVSIIVTFGYVNMNCSLSFFSLFIGRLDKVHQ